MPACTCTPHFRTAHLPEGGTEQVFVCTIFTPGCPVHEPPGEDDHFTSETPVPPPQHTVTPHT